MNFLELMEHEIELTEAPNTTIKGTVNAFSKINSYTAMKNDGGWVVSVSEHRDNIGVIFITDREVEYKDSTGNTVYTENTAKYNVTKRSLESHYIPTLLTRVKSDDMFSEELQHVGEQINEIASQGNYKAIGIMELSAFYHKASDAQKKKLQALIQKKDVNAVWDLVYQVTGLRI